MKKQDLRDQISQLDEEYTKLWNTKKRFRQYDHEIQLAYLQGRIYQLKFLLTAWPDEMTVPNLNEQ